MIRKSLMAKFRIKLFAGVLTDEHLKRKWKLEYIHILSKRWVGSFSTYLYHYNIIFTNQHVHYNHIKPTFKYVSWSLTPFNSLLTSLNSSFMKSFCSKLIIIHNTKRIVKNMLWNTFLCHFLMQSCIVSLKLVCIVKQFLLKKFYLCQHLWTLVKKCISFTRISNFTNASSRTVVVLVHKWMNKNESDIAAFIWKFLFPLIVNWSLFTI